MGGKTVAARLAKVELFHYRSYASGSVNLGEGLNVLAAPNAQGKTNFLEAVSLLSTGRLLRGHLDREAIQEGETEARVAGSLLDTGAELAVSFESRGRKKATLNGNALPRSADLLGRLPSVCLTMEDMAIVRGEPSARRLMLDLDLSAVSPVYLGHLTHYKRALEQRNSLLKLGRQQPVEDLLETWELPLAKHGAAIRQMRQQYVHELAQFASFEHAQISGSEELKIESIHKDEALDEEQLVELYQRFRRNDIDRGSTTIGPHRDDLSIQIDGRDARLFGSQGQQRTAVLSIKLASLKKMETELDILPILLLDDMLSDLDASRRDHLVEQVMTHHGQAILTCTDRNSVDATLLERAKLFTVELGSISELG